MANSGNTMSMRSMRNLRTIKTVNTVKTVKTIREAHNVIIRTVINIGTLIHTPIYRRDVVFRPCTGGRKTKLSAKIRNVEGILEDELRHHNTSN